MKIRYTNYKGITSDRRIIPLLPYFGSNEYHPEKQWLLKAWDIDKRALRSFAVSDIYCSTYSWKKDLIFFDVSLYIGWSWFWELTLTNKLNLSVFIFSNFSEIDEAPFKRMDECGTIIINKFGIGVAINKDYKPRET